ncbi:putative transporter C11D3.18C [Grifola frondosa]|uniref:Putative transporter C11D3.18C n=1 Tax=Grifola frondosa TaxID=5627 RepID=A0A1C7M9L3_GRIFR|nr:putative transporter C11D3.18C [Grifola frondosa]
MNRHAVQMVMSGFGDKDAEKQPSVQMIDGYAESDETYSIDPALEKRIVRRVDLRILPASMIICFLYFINRSNIASLSYRSPSGNAEVLNSDTGNSLAQSLHISNKQYLVALMIFFIPYTICETPSNYMLKKFGPSRWFAFIMFGWGAMTMILAATKNFGGFVAVRFLLGAFEAGFFPGIIYYLTFWYKPEERAVRIALIIACATLGGAFGGAIAFAVGKMNLARGLEAWRWLFIIEGAPSCAGALLTVPWLSTEEREVAIQRLKGVAPLGHDAITWKDARATLLDWRLYVHHLIFLAVSVPFSSISLFAPTIVEGLGYEGLDAQLFTVPPYAIAFVVTMIVAWISDRYEMRAWALLPAC